MNVPPPTAGPRSSCVERACRACERAWQEGRPPSIERFLKESPQAERAKILAELLAMEVAWRRRGGQTPAAEEYQHRFPTDAETVASVFRQIDSSPPTDPDAIETVPVARETAPYLGGGPAATMPAPAAGAADLPKIPDHEVLRLLGRGGMGVVYLARQVKLGRLVALKMIRGGGDDDQTARFLREARAAASLQHPHIVQIYEIGEQAGQPYLILEYVEGGSLDRKIEAAAPAPAESAALVQALARAMQAAHQRGIIHRDLKPANVMLTADGQPKITDFGLAKQMADDAGQTQTGQIMGSPSYMAPEQAAGQLAALGPATDVYALGAILYEMLTGRPPFRGNTILDTLEQVRSREPVPPHTLRPKVPRDLETICLKCLAKSPGRRYASALALAQDLERFQAGEPILARREGLAHRLWRKARRKPAVALSALAVALAVGLGYVVYQSRDTRHIMTTEHDLDARLDATDWTPSQINEMEARIEELERMAPARGASARERLAQRLAAHIEEAIRRPRLQPDDVTHVRDLLQSLEQRRPEAAPPLRQALEKRLRVWEPVLDLAAPFAAAAEVLDLGQFRAEVKDGGLRVTLASASGAGPSQTHNLLTRIPCAGNVRAEAHFDASWREARELGIFLNAEDGPSGPIASVAMSPDGKLLAAAGFPSDRPGDLKVWDTATGALLISRIMDQPGAAVLAFAPDGRTLFLAAPQEDCVRLLEPATGREQGRIAFPQCRPLCLAPSPDGRRLVVGGYGVGVGLACICDVVDRKVNVTLHGHPNGIRAVAYAPDGRTVATASDDGTVRLWNADTGETVATFRDIPAGPLSLAFAPEGGTLALAAGGRVKLWDITTKRPLPSFVTGVDVGVVAFTPDGRSLVTGHHGDGRVRLWDRASREVKKTLKAHAQMVNCLACSPENAALVTGGGDRIVRLWDAASGEMRREFREQGYAFLLRNVRPRAEGGAPPAPGTLGDPTGKLSLVILRNGTLLRQQEVHLPAGPLRLWVGRESNRLSFQANELPALVFQDVFPLREGGVFGLREQASVGLRRMQAWRQSLPAVASFLEQGDDDYDRGHYAEALNAYRRQSAAGGERGVLDEARFKEALCLLALRRPAEAAPLFEQLAVDAEPRWSILANCQLWLLHLRQDRFDEAAVLFERLTARYRFEDLAASIPEEVRGEILSTYGVRTTNLNLYKPDPQRVRNTERASAVEDFFSGNRAGGGMMKWMLYRAYHAAGQLDKAEAVLEERLRHYEPGMAQTYASIMEHSWLLRLRGQSQQALAEVDRWLYEKPGVPRESAVPLLLERSRIHAALGEWEQAERDIEDLFRLTTAKTLVGKHLPAAQLVRGLLRQRRGDQAGARAAWHQSDEVIDNLDPRFGFEFLYVLIMASYTDQLPDARADAFMKRLMDEMLSRDDRLAGSFARLVHFPPGALREMWRTPRGRDFAQKIAFQTISFADILAAAPKLLLAEVVRQGAWQGAITPDEEELVWKLIEDFYVSYAGGQLNTGQMVALGMTWKGTSGFLGWGGMAPKLPPARRGPLAYLFGQRYARALNKPEEAVTFFRTAVADAGADARLRRLAQAELDRPKKK